MEQSSATSSNGRTFLNKLKHPSRFSKPQLAIFVIAFAIVGYLLIRAFAAAPLVASLEAEQMSLPPGASVINDSSASAGKAIKLTANGSATGSVNFPSSVSSLSVAARGDQCQGAPAMSVSLDGKLLLSGTAVSGTSWSAYSVTPSAAIASGTHTLSISFNNAYTNPGHGKKHNGGCTRALYADVTNFYGQSAPPPTPPTVALSASPTSVNAGQSATLTWNSTNATACTASGAWSGSEPTSGSTTTGALNQTSTYTLTCTGTGGSANASASVSVTTPPPPPPPPSSGYIKGYYDQGSNQSLDWSSYKQYGFNMVISSINTTFLSQLKTDGATAWVQPNIWQGCSYEYSTSQALTWAQQAVATGAVSGFYVADEPSTSGCSTAPSQIAAWTATLHQNFPAIPTVIAAYDSSSLPAFKNSADMFALDVYPCQYGNGCNYSWITSLATAADNLGLNYVGVPQAFGGDGHYDLPTASQLTQIIDTWRATKEKGYVIYAFSAVGMPSSDYLQNHPELLSVIKTENAR